ncbi:7580_t:CDS:2, partial [Entrophospora sp. SA101]
MELNVGNGTITPEQYNKYFVVEPKLDEFIDRIKDGEDLLLYGPCASGKSTHIMYAMQKLQEEGYHLKSPIIDSVNMVPLWKKH